MPDKSNIALLLEAHAALVHGTSPSEFMDSLSRCESICRAELTLDDGEPLSFSNGCGGKSYILGSNPKLHFSTDDPAIAEIVLGFNLATLGKTRVAESELEDVLLLTSDYAYIHEFLPDGGIKLLWSKGDFENITGFTPEEIHEIGGWPVLIPEDEHPKIQSYIEKLRSGEKAHVDSKIRTKSGEIRWIRDVSRPRFNKRGEVTGSTGVAFDITDLRRTETELNESKKKLESLLGKTLDWVWEVDKKGIYIYASANVKDIMGYTPDEIIGKTPFDFMDKEEAIRIGSEFQRIVANKARIDRLQDTMLHKNGRTVLFETNGVPVFDSQGDFKGYFGTCRDITAQRVWEKKLLVSERLLREAELVSGSGAWEWDIQKDIVRVSEGWRKIHKTKSSVLTSKDIMNMVHPDDKEKVRAAFRSALQGRKVLKLHTRRIVDGEVIWIDCHSRVEFDDAGKAVKMYGACLDVTEREKTYSELRFQSMVLDQIKDLITVTDMDGIITYVNQAECELFGVERDMLIGNPVYAYGESHQEGATQREIVKKTHKGGFDGTVVNYTGKGEKIYLNVRTSLLKDSDGAPIGMLGISTDITEKKRFLDALKKSEENYRTLAENSLDIIIRYDRDMRHLYVSPAMETIWGQKISDFIGKTHREMGLDENMCRFWEEPIEEVLKTGKTVQTKFDYPLDGQITSWEWLLTPEFDDDGKVISVISYARNITEQENVIRALEESERRYQSLFEKSPFAMFVMEDGRYSMANPMAAKILGFDSTEDIIGKKPMDFIPEKMRKTILQRIKRIQAGKQNPTMEMEILRKDGSIITTESTSMPLVVGDKNVSLVISQDITARKEAQESLRRNEIFLHAIFNSIEEPITVMDRDMRIKHVNQATRDLHRDMLPIEGKRCIEVFDNVGCKECAVRRTFKTGNPERTIKPHPSEGKVYQITTYPIIDKSTGEAEYVVEALHDITERYEFERMLTESETQLRNAQRIARVGSWIRDLRAGTIVWSDVLYEIMGIDKGDDIDLIYIMGSIIHESDRERVQQFLRSIIQSGEAGNEELRIVRSDGRTFHILCKATPIKDESGDVVKIIGTVQDITTLKQIQLELREKVNELSMILGSIPDAIAFTDLDRKVRRINPSFTDIFGFETDDIVGKSVLEFYASKEDYLDMGRKKYNPDTDVSRKPYEIMYKRKSGEEFPAETIGFPVRDPNGIHVGYIGIIRDITEKKSLQKDKKKLENQLQRIQKLETIGTMAGGIAHDFNNLLSPILGYSELAQTTLPEEEPAREYIDQIKKSAQKARELIKKILIFSRQVEQKRQPTDLSRAISESLDLMRSTVPKSIKLERNLKPVVSNVDQTEIQQIVVNLITNAWHALPGEKGKISVTLEPFALKGDEKGRLSVLKRGDFARITVEDSGCGIPQKSLDRIFEPFYTTKEPGRGTGLGLSVVHGIVQNLGGTITVDSKVGKGSRIDIYLPAIEMPRHEPSKEEPCIVKGSESIVIIDDEEENTFLYSQILSRAGYNVRSYTNPLEADLKGADLVVTDMTMPNMNGLDLVRKIREDGLTVPVIIMTGYSERITREIMVKYDIASLLLKPVTTSELTTTIRKILDS